MPRHLSPALRRTRLARHARLLRARIRLLIHRCYFVPTIRATTWMYFAAAGLVGFGTLEALIGILALSPSAFPIILALLAAAAMARGAARRGIRMLRLALLRRHRRHRQRDASHSRYP